jgi:hypothetical protein
MPTRRLVSSLTAIVLSASLVAVIEVVAAGVATAWLVLVVVVAFLTTAGLGWDATRRPH